ncbi:MAG: hypothetical protein QM831_37120 [Kofleriaceae bacterium]
MWPRRRSSIASPKPPGQPRSFVEQGIDVAYSHELISEREIVAFVKKWMADVDHA